ncbi:hypothetical protein HYPSUDRAFT_45370 [Hypholoma sublateritium FD-334 SS-4]|uniref:Uncharacterized protein n=1 Tax=Hypholoma sublateritium (strain FD-334 SS-4) TaxID=945553 RepID=A0A0D2PDQ2_HYPSF|nr:hypothetical protein HYPSUDRAFT_45370 [Hypholoma sublateritium FD-334 SS-4]
MPSHSRRRRHHGGIKFPTEKIISVQLINCPVLKGSARCASENIPSVGARSARTIVLSTCHYDDGLPVNSPGLKEPRSINLLAMPQPLDRRMIRLILVLSGAVGLVSGQDQVRLHNSMSLQHKYHFHFWPSLPLLGRYSLLGGFRQDEPISYVYLCNFRSTTKLTNARRNLLFTGS